MNSDSGTLITQSSHLASKTIFGGMLQEVLDYLEP